MTTAFLTAPAWLTMNFCDSRWAVPHTCGSLPILRGGSFVTGPETVIVPVMDPPSVTSATSYAPGAFAAAPGGGGGRSLAGCSLVPRLQPAAIASISRTLQIDRPRFTRTSEFD